MNKIETKKKIVDCVHEIQRCCHQLKDNISKNKFVTIFRFGFNHGKLTHLLEDLRIKNYIDTADANKGTSLKTIRCGLGDYEYEHDIADYGYSLGYLQYLIPAEDLYAQFCPLFKDNKWEDVNILGKELSKKFEIDTSVDWSFMHNTILNMASEFKIISPTVTFLNTIID